MIVAEQFPSAQVIGTDLSPVQPTWVPINARMLLDDMDEPEWMHGSGYDLVHMRDMKCAIRDMDEVLVQIYSLVAPFSCLSPPSYLSSEEADRGS